MYAPAASNWRFCWYHPGMSPSNMLLNTLTEPILMFSPPPSHPSHPSHQPPFNRFSSQRHLTRPPPPKKLPYHAMKPPLSHYHLPPLPHYPRHRYHSIHTARPVKSPSQKRPRPVKQVSVSLAPGRLALVPVLPRPIPTTQVILLSHLYH